jgi:hypothetical protein
MVPREGALRAISLFISFNRRLGCYGEYKNKWGYLPYTIQNVIDSIVICASPKRGVRDDARDDIIIIISAFFFSLVFRHETRPPFGPHHRRFVLVASFFQSTVTLRNPQSTATTRIGSTVLEENDSSKTSDRIIGVRGVGGTIYFLRCLHDNIQAIGGTSRRNHRYQYYSYHFFSCLERGHRGLWLPGNALFWKTVRCCKEFECSGGYSKQENIFRVGR